MMCIFQTYQKISNLFNEEKVLEKDNWRDSTIVTILENEIYKGDFVHGKRTNHPTFYEDVVEPIASKEMWEDCQVQILFWEIWRMIDLKKSGNVEKIKNFKKWAGYH